MKKPNEQLLNLLTEMCSPAHEDLAGLNWVTAGEMIAALPVAARSELLTTEVGRQIQERLWQIWSGYPNLLANSDLERTLVSLTDEVLVKKILKQGQTETAVIRLMGKMRHPAAVEHLRQIANSPVAPLSRRAEAIEALGKSGLPAAIAAIEPWLADDTLHETALMALGWANSPESATILLDRLKAGEAGKIEDALQLLSHSSLTPLLLTNLSLDTPPLILPVLGRVGDEAVVQPILTRLYQAAQKLKDANVSLPAQLRYEQFIDKGLEALVMVPATAAAEALAEVARHSIFDDNQRERAIQKLNRMSVPPAHQALLTLVLDPALPVDLREQAALSLPRPLPTAIEQTVLTALADSGPVDQTQAPLVTALRFASSQTGRTALLKLLQHPDPLMQDEAAASLGVRREAEALTPLLDLLQKRRVVGLDIKPLITALGQLGHPGATSTLSAILQDETLAHTWKTVITALAQIGDVRAIPALIAAGQQAAAENFGVWSALVSAFATIGHPDGINFLLDQFSRDPDQAGRWLGVFRRITHEEAIPPLLDRGLTSPIAAVREKAIVGLGSIGTERVIPGLITGLRDPDEDVRLAAENGLTGYAGTIHDLATVELILAAVPDPTINHNWPLLDCLPHTQGNAAILAGERLVSRLETGEFADGDMLWRIVMLLGQLRASQAVKSLGDLLLTHPDPGIRRYAAQALGRIGTGESARFLIRAFSNQPNDDIRQALIQIRYLCELIDHLPLTRDILTTLAVRYHLRIFADGRVTLPEGPPRPCQEALKFL